MIAGAALIFAAAGFFVVLALLVGVEERRLTVLKKVERDLLRPREHNEDVFYLSGLEGLLEKEKKRLAGLEIKPQDFLLFKTAVAVAAVVLGAVSGWLIPGIAAAVLSVYAANFIIDRFREARRRQIESPAFLDMLYDMAATMRVVPRFEDALKDARARIPDGRLAAEIDRTLNAIEGSSVEEALFGFAERSGSPLAQAWADNIVFARRAGADMADVCLKTAEKVRERLRFAREIRASASGAKATAAGIAGVLGLSVALQVFSGQMADVLASPAGRTVVGLAVLVMVAGSFWIWSIIEREVEM